MKQTVIWTLGLSILLSGCAAAITERTSQRATRVALVAQSLGNWDGSRRAWAKAVFNAERSGYTPDKLAILTYEYGRALGVTCRFESAEDELLRAHELDRQAGQPLYLSLTELARLNLAQKKYQATSDYFERAFRELDAADAERIAPIAYADFLDEHAQALSGLGREERAQELRQRALNIRQRNPGKKSITDTTPYGQFCDASTD